LWVACFLLVTGLLLWTSEAVGRRIREIESLKPDDALLIGLAQAIAIAPGISRSGATISMGLMRKLERPAAARFSFLMMIPVVFGAGLLQLADLLTTGATGSTLLILATGLLAAAITGYASIAFLLDYLARRSVRIFAVYCWLFGAFSLLVAFLR
ncbi:MAG: undecaprenyl-diphosphate phosphatase, partial [Ardenticatenaceae bacterium]